MKRLAGYSFIPDDADMAEGFGAEERGGIPTCRTCPKSDLGPRVGSQCAGPGPHREVLTRGYSTTCYQLHADGHRFASDGTQPST